MPRLNYSLELRIMAITKSFKSWAPDFGKNVWLKRVSEILQRWFTLQRFQSASSSSPVFSSQNNPKYISLRTILEQIIYNLTITIYNLSSKYERRRGIYIPRWYCPCSYSRLLTAFIICSVFQIHRPNWMVLHRCNLQASRHKQRFSRPFSSYVCVRIPGHVLIIFLLLEMLERTYVMNPLLWNDRF